MVKIEGEIGEALPKATAETAKILKGAKRDLADIISELPDERGPLSPKQQLKVSKLVKRLQKVPAADALKLTTMGWVTDLLKP